MAFEIPEERPEKRRRRRAMDPWAFEREDRETVAAELGPMLRARLGLGPGKYEAAKELEKTISGGGE